MRVRPRVSRGWYVSVQVELRRLIFQDAAPTLDESGELVFVVQDAFAHHSADYSVKSGTVATTSKYSNSHMIFILNKLS